MNNKIYIYGLGRMGLSHYSILNQLSDTIDCTFIEPNWKLKYFGTGNIDAKIRLNDSKIGSPADFSLICTPPVDHVNTIEKCIERGDKNIFCEKPFGGIEDDFSTIIKNEDRVRVGYVLRFNPVVQWLKSKLDKDMVTNVTGSYISNTLEKRPTGWRNGSYSGVLNEMGSHIIDILHYLLGLSEPTVKNKKVESKLSDVDDIVQVELMHDDIAYNLHFDWVNKAYRKPIFHLEIELKDGKKYVVDQQKVDIYCKDNEWLNSVSVVDISEEVPFYFRGVDFTKQMQDFMNGQQTMATVEEALETRKIIKTILA